MPEIRFSITLDSDAEPGTGLGTELIDDVVPQRGDNTPFLPGSHLKGLLRESLRGIVSQLGWQPEIETLVFGDEGRNGGDGQQGALRIGDATASRTGAPTTGVISRTALNPFGTARTGSLRTVECIPAGTVFRGTARIADGCDPIAADAVRLAMLSLGAVGGNRNRGAGSCSVSLDAEPALKPSTVLRKLDAALRGKQILTPRFAGEASVEPSASRAVFLELTFDARDPVCCPAVPLTGTNTMRSGFAIPASAVQGAVLHLLDRVDHDAASRMFASPAFRAWPLLPCAPAGTPAAGVMPVWTSLTHRMSKTAAGAAGTDIESPFFRDKLVEPFDWRAIPSGAPLKAADGVLLASNGQVRLWRASDMPRHLSAHVNLQNNEPLLFTVEAMAPMVFRGILAVPEEFVGRILDLIKSEPECSFGRARAVRGGGTLRAAQITSTDALPAGHSGTTFVVQSPLSIPRTWIERREESPHGGEILQRLVEDAGFGAVEQAEATIEYRFGWSRHGMGRRVSTTNRLAAEPVIAPGSAFKLSSPLAERGVALLERLASGVGDGRERGFGSVLPHPGIASGVYRGAPAVPEIRSRDKAGSIAAELAALSKDSEISTSTISQLVQLARGGPKHLEDYIGRQKSRPSRTWEKWQPLAARLLALAQDKSINDETRARALRGWTDATSAKAKGGVA
jgi:hypothetical protein